MNGTLAPKGTALVNTARIALKRYLQAVDADFERAAGTDQDERNWWREMQRGRYAL